jgi:hypothetical protein
VIYVRHASDEEFGNNRLYYDCPQLFGTYCAGHIGDDPVEVNRWRRLTLK